MLPFFDFRMYIDASLKPNFRHSSFAGIPAYPAFRMPMYSSVL
jgi:hypothetical protein